MDVPTPAAVPCKIRRGTYQETCRTPDAPRTKYACIVEADESTRKRLEGTLHKDHEDQIARKGRNIAGKGINSLNHCNLVRKFILIPKAMNISNAKATVHFASLMDICHLENSELEPKFQKYKGRIVPRGDMVKDDSGSYAVFTEHGYHIQIARMR